MGDVHIVGVGIHPFGRHADATGLDLGVFAARKALADAGLRWEEMQFAFGGSSAAGNADAVLPRLGLTGVQFINVANACATGGSALLSAYWAIKSGEFDIGLVVGFDKHPAGAFNFQPQELGLPAWYGETGLMLTTQFFAMKIRRYMEQYAISQRALGLVAEKAFRRGSEAPHAWRRMPPSLDEILNAPLVADPLTKYMLCSPSEGGAALVIASARTMKRRGLSGPRIRAAAVRTRGEESFEVFAASLDINRGPPPTKTASAAAFEMAGLGPRDIDFAQLQDTESGAEIMHLAENGFCADGDQEHLIRDGATDLGGTLPVNTDGGCLACGEPIGATGLRQVYESVLQLQGRAGTRQVEQAKIGYTHVYGLPGISSVTILERYSPKQDT